MANSSSTKRLRDDTYGNLHRHNVGLQSVTGSYSISFDSAFMQRDVRLIEVSEDLVNCLISGESLNIIGPVEASGKGDDSHAVLTTGHKTFSIKKVETSNAVYLLNPSNSDVFTIHSASQDYYELKLIPPRISKIRDLLQSSVYDGMDCEAMSNIEQSNLLSYNELRCQVQASDTEFSAALFSFGVVELRGKMRQLSKQAIAETTKQLIYTIIENDWDIDNISEELCSTSIPDTDPILLNFSLKSLGESITSSSLQDKIGSNFWALNKDAVSRATAHNLFRAQGQSTKPWECQDFLRTWDAETPGANIPDPRLLEGIAVKIESKSHKSCTSDGSVTLHSYHYLPCESLSSNLQVRLGELFAVRAKYTEEELQPYFKDMILQRGMPHSVPELLLPHTRYVDDNFMAM